MVDLTTVVTSKGARDQRWLSSDHGLSNGLTRTLDITKFAAGTHYDATNRYLYSGIALAKITASGLYGPYDTTATDGRQSALDSFLLFEENLVMLNGLLSSTVAVAVVRHAYINPAYLPIAAQKVGGASDVTTATTKSEFVFEV